MLELQFGRVQAGGAAQRNGKPFCFNFWGFIDISRVWFAAFYVKFGLRNSGLNVY